MRVVLLGPPGSGKDTICNPLVSDGLCELTPGQVFREQANRGTPLGLHARDTYWGNGTLCPDDIVNKLVENEFLGLKLNDQLNLVFNGYPRSVGQAEHLDSFCVVDYAVLLKCSQSTCTKRLLLRGRVDDEEEIIQKRFEQYNEKTKPVIQYYLKHRTCSLIEIEAEQSIEDVRKKTYELLGIKC